MVHRLDKDIEIKQIENSKTLLKCPTCNRDNQRGKLLTNVIETGEEDCGNGNSFSWSVGYETVQCCGCETVFSDKPLQTPKTSITTTMKTVK
jgi:hypothetical protein